MIGAMPAVAVRHERGKVNTRLKRAKFHLRSPWKISSANSTPTNAETDQTFEIEELPEYYIFGKISSLHVIVGLLLLGSITLVVGLVQLTPGAADADHRYVFLSIGSTLILLGLIMTAVRCLYLHFYKNSESTRSVHNDLHPTIIIQDEEPKTSNHINDVSKSLS